MSDASMMNSSSDRCRTVVVSGVPDELCSSRMNDKLTIHFQCTRSHGGDVEMVQYPTHLKGVAFVTFDNWRDADRVVKSNQVLKDKEFKEEHPLTVYTYTPEVAFYAYADLDLSLYPDPSTLIATLRSNHKSVRIQPSQNKPGFVSAEGPFAALQRLRKQLLSETQNKIDISDEALKEESLRSDKAWTQEETLRSDKAWTQEEAFRSDKARTQEEALRSDKAWTQGEPLRSDKARTQGEALRSYNTSRQDKASSFDRSRSRDKASISDKARTQEEALRSDKDRTQDKAPRLYKASSQDNASSFDKSWRQDAAGQLKVDDMTITNGTNCVSFWLDTHIYKYMQMVERNEWDRCVGRYNVTAHAVSTGEVTEVKLHGRCEGSVLLSAQGELETLVAKSQDTLRTQHIDCSSADAMERLLQVCKTAQSIYTKVCYFPSDSCVEVIGPSSSSHRFCEFVKTMTEQEF